MAEDEIARSLGIRFFQAQDRLRGGPDPDLCSPGYQARIAGFPVMPLAGHQEFAKAFYTGFPDVHHVIGKTVAERNRVAVHFTIHGTHRGDFMGMPPTDATISVRAIAILEFADGRVTELEAVFDRAGLMEQLTAGLGP